MPIVGVDSMYADEKVQLVPYKNTDYVRLPAVTALLKRYNLRDESIVHRSWVVLSPGGMSVSDSEGSTEVVKNFNSRKIWMIDRKRKMYYALEVDKYQKEFPELAANLFSTSAASNLISQTACEGWFGELKGERVWRGRIVQEWECSDGQQVVVNNQYFSVEFGLVVRVEGADLAVDELTDIKNQQSNEFKFEPPSAFVAVSKEQFVNDKVELKSYEKP